MKHTYNITSARKIVANSDDIIFATYTIKGIVADLNDNIPDMLGMLEMYITNLTRKDEFNIMLSEAGIYARLITGIKRERKMYNRNCERYGEQEAREDVLEYVEYLIEELKEVRTTVEDIWFEREKKNRA